jgi:hypothetical protein
MGNITASTQPVRIHPNNDPILFFSFPVGFALLRAQLNNNLTPGVREAKVGVVSLRRDREGGMLTVNTSLCVF